MPCEYQNDPHFAPCMPCEYQNDPHFALCMPCEHSNVIQIAIKRASARGSGDKCRTIRLPPHPPPAADHSSLRDVWRANAIRPYMYPANFAAPAGAAPTRVQSFIPAGCLGGGRMQFAPTRGQSFIPAGCLGGANAIRPYMRYQAKLPCPGRGRPQTPPLSGRGIKNAGRASQRVRLP